MLCPTQCGRYVEEKGKCACGADFRSTGNMIKSERRKHTKRKSDGLDGLAKIVNKIPNVIRQSRSTTWLMGKKKGAVK